MLIQTQRPPSASSGHVARDYHPAQSWHDVLSTSARNSTGRWLSGRGRRDRLPPAPRRRDSERGVIAHRIRRRWKWSETGNSSPWGGWKIQVWPRKRFFRCCGVGFVSRRRRRLFCASASSHQQRVLHIVLLSLRWSPPFLVDWQVWCCCRTVSFTL